MLNATGANETTRQRFQQWAVLELMGHRRLAGLVTDEEVFGVSLMRLDIPGQDGEKPITQYYSPSSLYCLTPTTEEVARSVAAHNRPQLVNRWELPAPKPEMGRPRVYTSCPQCGAETESPGGLCEACGDEYARDKEDHDTAEDDREDADEDNFKSEPVANPTGSDVPF